MTNKGPTAPIDLSSPVREICTLLGLDYTSVRRLELRPNKATAEVLLRNDAEHHYLDEDTEMAAVELHEFNTKA